MCGDFDPLLFRSKAACSESAEVSRWPDLYSQPSLILRLIYSSGRKTLFGWGEGGYVKLLTSSGSDWALPFRLLNEVVWICDYLKRGEQNWVIVKAGLWDNGLDYVVE